MTHRNGGDEPPPGDLTGRHMLPAPMSEVMACWVALRDIDFDLCVNPDVVNDVLESELNEVELVVAEDLSKAHGALGADTLGAGFELVEVLSRDVEASSELRKRLLVRLTDAGEELRKRQRPRVERLEKGVGDSVELLCLGGSFLGGHGQ